MEISEQVNRLCSALSCTTCRVWVPQRDSLLLDCVKQDNVENALTCLQGGQMLLCDSPKVMNLHKSFQIVAIILEHIQLQVQISSAEKDIRGRYLFQMENCWCLELGY